jgi:hypothetical protein
MEAMMGDMLGYVRVGNGGRQVTHVKEEQQVQRLFSGEESGGLRSSHGPKCWEQGSRQEGR